MTPSRGAGTIARPRVPIHSARGTVACGIMPAIISEGRSMRIPVRVALASLVTMLSLLVAVTSYAASAPGSAGAKLASKCQQTIAKATAKFLAGRAKRIADR